MGIHLLWYLSDWLFLASSKGSLLQDKDCLLASHNLEIVINWQKSDLILKQQIKYLGMLLDTTVIRTFQWAVAQKTSVR